jgi:hypothetical protein
MKNIFYSAAFVSIFFLCCSAQGAGQKKVEYLGYYSNQVSSNSEDPHLQGYSLNLFREDSQLFGRFCFATGIEVPCAPIENVIFYSNSSNLTFKVRMSLGREYGKDKPPEGRPSRDLIEFNGKLAKNKVTGTLLLKDGYNSTLSGESEFIILKRSSEKWGENTTSYAQWSADPLNRPLSRDWEEKPAISVPINESLWMKIDKVNETLQKSNKPVSTKLIAEVLGEAVNIMNDPEFSKDYENIVGNAIKNDEVQANLLSERAEPAFAIFFGGDYEFKQVNWKYFKSLAASGSEAGEFFKLYPGYLHVIQSGWPSSCYLPFNFPEMSDETRKIGKITPKIKKEWKQAAQKWQEPFFKSFAQRAVQCLDGHLY